MFSKTLIDAVENLVLPNGDTLQLILHLQTKLLHNKIIDIQIVMG